MLDEANAETKTVTPKLATISVDKLRPVSVGLKAIAVKQLRTKLGMALRAKVKFILILSNGCVHARMLQMADVAPPPAIWHRMHYFCTAQREVMLLWVPTKSWAGGQS